MGILKNKHVTVVLTGSIGIVKSVEFIRELQRQGSIVQAVMTKTATKLIGETSLEWATGEKVFTQITGRCEYLEYAGFKSKSDLVIVFSSANTLSKIAQGITDNIATLFAGTALGSKMPLLIVPMGHMELFENKIIIQNTQKVIDAGANIFTFEKEGAYKFPVFEMLLLESEKILSKQSIKGKKIVIVSGPTSEKIDEIRSLTNNSTGNTGFEIAKEAYRKGAKVTLISSIPLNLGLFEEIAFSSSQELTNIALNHLEEADYLFCPAAISDFSIKSTKGKLSSKNKQALSLNPAPKFLELAREKFPKLKICAFKLDIGTQKDLEKKCKILKKKVKAEIVVGNLLKDVKEKNTKCVIFSKKKRMFKGSKEDLAILLVRMVV